MRHKKKWLLGLLILLLAIGYYRLYYKTWSNSAVPQSADCIIALDVKKITNTLIWNFITTPAQWKLGNLFAPDDGKVGWKDMLQMPDYAFVFHKAGQPANAFYIVLQLKDAADFRKGLQQYHFAQTTTGSYLSKDAGIELIQNGNNILIGNAAVTNREFIRETANELFTKKQFIAADSLKLLLHYHSHLSAMLPLPGNELVMQKQLFVQGGFDKHAIHFTTVFKPAPAIPFSTQHFEYADSSFISMGGSVPWLQIKQALPISLSTTISTAINFEIDSLLLPSNRQFQLDVPGFYPGIDSAISYAYDDNFNPIEQAVVNKVVEPAFNFSVKGDSVFQIYNYWKNAGKLDSTEKGSWFTPVPFVKSYCSVVNAQKLIVESANYKKPKANEQLDCIFFLRLLLTKMPASLSAYLPASIAGWLQNIEYGEVKLTKHSKATATKSTQAVGLILEAGFTKKKNDLPLFNF